MFGFEKDSPGSGIVEAMLFVLVIAFFCFAGWITYKSSNLHKAPKVSDVIQSSSNKPTSTGTSTSSQSSTTTKPPATTTTTTTPPAVTTPVSKPNANVVVITGMGIEITVPDTLKGLTYSISPAAGNIDVISFSTQSLSAEVPSCAATVNNGAFDTIDRGNGSYPGAGSNGGLIKQYQNPTYYLAYVLPSGPCAKGLTPSEQSLLDQQAQDFYTSLSTVQAT